MQRFHGLFILGLVSVLLIVGCISGNGNKNNVVNVTHNYSNFSSSNNVKEYYSVSFSTLPTDVYKGQKFKIVWQVYSTVNTNVTTGLVYDTKSIAYPETPSDYTYSFAEEEEVAPMYVSQYVSFNKTGTYYVRAYALINGKVYWSNERAIVVNENKRASQMNIETNISYFTVDIYDHSVSPTEIRVKTRKVAAVTFQSHTKNTVYVDVPLVGRVQLNPLERKTLYIDFYNKPKNIMIEDTSGKVLYQVLMYPSG